MGSLTGLRAALLRSQLLRFGLVGCVGFVTDAGLTVGFHSGLGLGEAPARVLAFVVAATVTWWLNRRFTFRVQSGASSWLRYVAITSAGAVINIACYLGVVRALGTQPMHLLAGVAVGSVVAMGFNFWVSRNWVFAADASTPPT
ncbi:MAG: GtrA family protein [Burkholderiales bacterium]|nr:GtrA family protein [Burkholderiales bacterium]